MEAKDLMIGDWVRYNDIQTKVNYLTEDRIATNDNYVACSEVDSIPLTEDILKANGFCTNVKGYECYAEYQKMTSTYNCLLLSIGKNGVLVSKCINNASSKFKLNGIKFNYVHELQHALRLCGLNELADNFKLKEE